MVSVTGRISTGGALDVAGRCAEHRGMRASLGLALSFVLACGGSGGGDGDAGGGVDAAVDGTPEICVGQTCSGHGTCLDVDGAQVCQCDGGYVRVGDTACEAAVGPTLGGCPLLPVDHVFNTPIDTLPVHPQSAAFIGTIGATRRVHLDLGTQTDQQASDFYGVPFNLVNGAALSWPEVVFASPDPGLDWDPRPESDCATGAARTLARPCTAANAPAPLLPIPPDVVVEGGINRSADHQPYGDHHILVVDTASCVLWEAYHAYQSASGRWNIFGSAAFDLRSNALRPADWTSADAAGFPILPLLLREAEASTGTINHALRFTIASSKIRTAYVWPARHLTGNGTGSTSLPPMGQLFRLKASVSVPATHTAQARAIMTALKTYGMYIADGGSDMYITGDPSAAWDDRTLSQVQALTADDFEAVDLTPIMNRGGFDPDSGRVP